MDKNAKTPTNKTRATLVVDLDGTLTPTDTLVESVIKLLKLRPIELIKLLLVLPRGPLAFKQYVADKASIDIENFPWRQDLVDYIRYERSLGRRTILATAAHQSIAKRVADHLDLFDEVLSTGTEINLKGEAKLEAIRQSVGEAFVYAGDSDADVPIWNASTAAILVGVKPKLAKFIKQSKPIEREFQKQANDLSRWVKAFRLHQWLKNLLLFVPILTAFTALNPEMLLKMALAFLSFSLAASASYIGNDLWDLESDRAHPRKRFRPFASASIRPLSGLLVATGTLATAVALAHLVSDRFLLILFVYLIITSAYSWLLKGYVIVDVLTLSALYTLRILAGSLAFDILISSWLLAFSVFAFFSLALIKRCSELVSLKLRGMDAASGRDYRVTDLVVLWPLGVGAALSAVVIFGLFISSPDTQSRYTSPQLLWLAAIGLVYWLARLWIKTSRGDMHDDPIIYAIKDSGGRIALAGIIVAIVAARFI